MKTRRSFATASLVVCAMAGCAAPPEADDAPLLVSDAEQPLDLNVDDIDIVHGALRLSATMVDGAADVSVKLGGACDRREVGGGLSTLSTLVWVFGENDVAEALRCGLVVSARTRGGALFVSKVAELAVTVDVAAESDDTEAAPRLQGVSVSSFGVGVAFVPVTRSARLTTGDSILEAETPEEGEALDLAGESTGRFTVPWIDFARSVLRQRPFVLEGASFGTSLSVGGVSLSKEPQEEEAETQEEPQPPGEP